MPPIVPMPSAFGQDARGVGLSTSPPGILRYTSRSHPYLPSAPPTTPPTHRGGCTAPCQGHHQRPPSSPLNLHAPLSGAKSSTFPTPRQRYDGWTPLKSLPLTVSASICAYYCQCLSATCCCRAGHTSHQSRQPCHPPATVNTDAPIAQGRRAMTGVLTSSRS